MFYMHSFVGSVPGRYLFAAFECWGAGMCHNAPSRDHLHCIVILELPIESFKRDTGVYGFPFQAFSLGRVLE